MIACLALFISLGAGASAINKTAKLPANSVGSEQLKPNSVKDSETAPGSIGSKELEGSSVDETKLEDGSVGTVELADNSVVGSKIPDLGVGGGKLGEGSVAPSKLAVQPAARVTRTANQSIAGSAQVLVNWTSEVFDTQAMHNNSVNNTRLTAPIDGIYDVSANIDWAAHNDAGPRLITLVKNGSSGIAAKGGNPISPTSTYAQDVTATVSMQKGDYIEVKAFQIHDFSNVAGIPPPPSIINPLDIVSDVNVSPHFSLTYVAPAE